MSHLKTASLGLIGLAVGGFLLSFLGIFGIHYLHAIENDPFPMAVEVTSILGDQITLRDGRVLKFTIELDSSVQEAIQKNGGRIGLEIDEDSVATLYGRRERTICGVGMPLIIIPLIPIDVPRYERKSIINHWVEIVPARLGTEPKAE